MGLLFIVLAFSFVIVFLVNVTWLGLNLSLWITNGLQFILQGMNFVEGIYASTFLRWILFVDGLWLLMFFAFLLKRKHYKTVPALHYLSSKPISSPKICVVMPTYNEELVVGTIVKEFFNQKNVESIIVVDNHSSDRTVEIAKKLGAQVITKESNKGYADSAYLGLRESLKTNANIIVLVDADGTHSAKDLEKMAPYLDNCDMVIGTRQVQILTEKGNQLGMFHVWGNLFLAKLIQIKYLSLLHMGIVQLTDVGCTYRCIKREALEKLIDQFTYPGTNKVVVGDEFALYMILLGINNEIRILEIPITFKKRIGISKTGSDKKKTAFWIGLKFIWAILRF